MSLSRNRLWTIGSGKGGVGKSLLTASMGIALAQAGRSVIVVDANLATPNLHAYFGIKAPACTLLDTYWKDMQALRGLDASDRLAESMHAQNYHVIREIETRKSKFESALAG